jgi:hypothetical protein
MLSMLQNPRQAAAQVLNFALILSSAFMVPQTTAQISSLCVNPLF